jgi:hypothetical protein
MAEAHESSTKTIPTTSVWRGDWAPPGAGLPENEAGILLKIQRMQK